MPATSSGRSPRASVTAATLCRAEFVEGLRDDQIEALFNTARDADYAQLAMVAREAAGGLPSRLRADDERRSAHEQRLCWHQTS